MSVQILTRYRLQLPYLVQESELTGENKNTRAHACPTRLAALMNVLIVELAEIDGSRVYDACLTHNQDSKIADYCRKDVECTRGFFFTG